MTSKPERPALRILLVEDNETNQDLIIRALRRRGFNVDVAENGRLGLEAVLAQHYDVVLMDVQMPVMDGIEATRRIRQELGDRCQPHIIALTANVGRVERETCLAAVWMAISPSRWPCAIFVFASTSLRQETCRSSSLPEAMRVFSINMRLIRLRAMLGASAPAAMSVFTQNFLRDAVNLQVAAHTALAANDAEHLRRIAHTLKANSALFGARTLSEICREIEDIARGGRVVGCAELLQSAEREFIRVQHELEALI
ncbi:response regulator [Candidatus Gracilibacteria bacterium]|nr:response regulator [Candidatus Gracilibacteria bacterium]